MAPPTPTEDRIRVSATPSGGRTLADLARQLLAAGLAAIHRQDVLAGHPPPETVARLAWAAVSLLLGALVAYTGLMFLLWSAVAVTFLALTGAGVTQANAAWLSFLIMGVVGTAVGALVVSISIKALRQESNATPM